LATVEAALGVKSTIVNRGRRIGDIT
jgi:hypothetical protein